MRSAALEEGDTRRSAPGSHAGLCRIEPQRGERNLVLTSSKPAGARRLTGLALACAAITASPSWAAPGQRTCLVVTDPSGDAHGAAFDIPAAGPELDLLEGRLAVTGSTLSVSMKVRPNPTVAPTAGQQWQFALSDGERRLSLVATRAVDGDHFAAYGGSDGPNQPYLGLISGEIDLALGRVSMAAPLAQLEVRATKSFNRYEASTSQGEATSGAFGLPAQASTFGADQALRLGARALNARC